MLKSNNIFFLFLILFTNVNAQVSKNKLLFPIKPGTPNSLSANMGELRPNHFHGGYDIKTDGKIGYPVYASEDGYVSRIKVSTFGYGNVVYITHPGNLQTVYAHLDKFNGPIGKYTVQKQYEQQSFQVELFLKPGEIPVKRGEIIGLAGNSGSSQGPHLHYEIRDTLDRVLNPSDFGFKEITDNIPPIFQKIAITPMDITSRVYGDFDRKEFTPKKTGSTYSLPGDISVNGLLGLELKALDKKNHSHNSFGINYAEVLLDDKVIFSYNLYSFTFDETRYINTHIDYPIYSTTGKRFEKLYVSDGDKLSSYTYSSPLKGRILINDNQIHKVKIIIKDDFRNESVLVFNIKGTAELEKPIPATTLPNQLITSDIIENTLKISTKAAGDAGGKIYLRGKELPFPASYEKFGWVTYLYDLRKGLPDSVKIGSLRADFNFIKSIAPRMEQKAAYENISVLFPSEALADTLYLQMRKDDPYFFIHSNIVPLYDSIRISIAPQATIENKSKAFVYYINRNRPDFEGGCWNGNKIEVKTRNLGKFTLLEDTIKPSISLLSNYGNSVQFKITDDLSGINTFKATLDGYWILMNYDHKRNLIWSERLDKTVPLKGEFILEVTDNAGNTNKFTINI